MRFPFKRIVKKFVKIKITRAGAIYTFITIFIGVAAVNTGNNLLFVMLSLLLSFMWLSGVFASYNLKGISVEVYPPSSAFAGNKSMITLKIRNQKRLPAFILKIGLKLINQSYVEVKTVVFPQVKDTAEKIIVVTPNERGEATVLCYELSSPFPLALFVRYLGLNKEAKFVVYPKPTPCEVLQEMGKAPRKSGERQGSGFGVGDFLGLKDYFQGVPKKLIHWKSLAKREELMIKDLAEELSAPLMIEVEQLPGGNLEDKLSCATYLVLKCEAMGLPYGLNLFGKKFPVGFGPAHQRIILTELALYGKKKT